MFELAYEHSCDKKAVKINERRKFEWALTQTGDYALEYTLWVYLERIPNTKVTSTIRRHLMGTVYHINEQVYRAAVAEGVNLYTPILSEVQLSQ